MRLWLALLAVSLVPVPSAQGRAATAGCATRAPNLAAVAAPSGGELAEPGASAVLLCRYRGLNPPATARELSGSRLVVARPLVQKIATELDALPKAPALIHCPMDDGSEITVTFETARGTSGLVVVGLTGCRTVTNGRFTRTASTGSGPQLIAELEALVP